MASQEQEDLSHSHSHIPPSPPHVLCIPIPYQSHIGAMLKFAKLLHSRGFRVTFVNTEFNHRRLLKSQQQQVHGLPDFEFRTIPDGLPPSNPDASQDGALVIGSVRNFMPAPFINLITDIDNDHSSEKITWIVSDGLMSFTTDPAAHKFGIPIVHFWSISACSLLGFKQFRMLMDNGLIPPKDVRHLTDGYLDQPVDCIPGMRSRVTLKDLPTYLRTTDPDDIRLNFAMEAAERSDKASAVVVHTFDELESDVLSALSSVYSPPIYSIGPLQLLLDKDPVVGDNPLKSVQGNLWKEDMECLHWLDSKGPNSVLYVNLGSIASITWNHLLEFATGLANSKHPFLWIIRPDILEGREKLNLPAELFKEMEAGRGMLSEWCPQQEVLNHPSTAGFLTHCGWNSVLESISAGIPMICWPCFADQSTNCMYVCREWGAGIELDGEVTREKVERLVRELMGGHKGIEMKRRALELKKLAEEGTNPNCSSSTHLDKLISEVLGQTKRIG